MATEPIILNPLGWVQLQLVGGWRRQLFICITCLGVTILILTLIYRTVRETSSLGTFCGGALNFFMFLQGLLLLFAGTNAVRRAIHRDFTTEMISLHRMTAMNGHTAVLGYLSGSTAQFTALTLTNWLVCVVLAEMSTSGPMGTFLGQLALLVMTVCLSLVFWTLAALVALATRGKVSVLGLLIPIAVASSTGAALLLPGLAMILPPPVWSLVRGAPQALPGSEAAICVISQLALSFTFFLAAARKFQRDDVRAMNPPLAYSLLTLCTLICAVGFSFRQSSMLSIISPVFERSDAQWVSTLTCLLLVALIPVSGAAADAAAWVTRHHKDPHFRTPAPRPYWESPVIASLLVLGVLWVIMSRSAGELMVTREDIPVGRQMVIVSVAFFLALMTTGGVLRFTYSITNRAVWVLVFFAIVFWCIPLFVDLSIDAIFDRDPSGQRTLLFACSPIGTWIATCTNTEAPVIGGLIVQLGLAIGALILAGRSRRPKAALAPTVGEAAAGG